MNALLDFGKGIVSEWHRRGPGSFWIVLVSVALFSIAAFIYSLVYLAAPVPRPPFASEQIFSTVEENGKESLKNTLPSWMDEKSEESKDDEASEKSSKGRFSAGPAEVLMSVVVPAFNEEKRLPDMLADAVEYLNKAYPSGQATSASNGVRQRKTAASSKSSGPLGWEILIVSDGSTDKTEAVALNFAKNHPGGSIRVVKLVQNRGKGGAVIHGMRHVRGKYIAFADADGASRFEDLAKLVEACDSVKDSRSCALAVGSRAHLVNSEAVVNRSVLRNFLMYAFHLLIWLATPPATSRIKDTQCGFKLMTREALPYIVPHMNSEGWIFDVEMLMLAERADVPVKEVPVGWHEVKGSKLNVFWDSIGMAWTLLVLRVAWALGVYRIDGEDANSQKTLSQLLDPNEKYIKYKGPPKYH